MDTSKNPNLFKLLQESLLQSEGTSDPKNYRYIIYARKSTDANDKQTRSLGDQITECQELAKRQELQVIGIVQESESAKEPDIRRKFRKILEDIQRGNYEGIISWHPDRLARNMKEAGEVIDLLDKNIIKELKFPSYTFENSPNGKMVLGMTFVISKQYSDQLGVNVKRGNERSIEEGRFIGNKPPHGYIKDPNFFLRPDGHNYALMKEAFQMRITRKAPLDEIAEFLNKNKYSGINPSGDRVFYKMNKKRLSEIMSNPVYVGYLMHGKNLAILPDLYEFLPMISEDDYWAINKRSPFDVKVNSNFRLYNAMRRGVRAELFRKMVICGECDKTMSATITKKSTGKSYFFFRCETKGCKRKGKGTRANIVREFIVDFLQKNNIASKKTYEHFHEKIKILQKEKNVQYNASLNTIRKSNQKLKEKASGYRDYIPQIKDKAVQEDYENQLKQTLKDISTQEVRMSELKSALEQNKQVILDYQKFLELFQNLAQRVAKTKKMDELNYIGKLIFLNFTIKDQKVASYKLKPPFQGAAKVALCAFSSNGGPDGIRTRDLSRDRRAL